MKRLVILFMISVAAWSAYAQDLIVTTNHDTIPCYITKIDDELISLLSLDIKTLILPVLQN